MIHLYLCELCRDLESRTSTDEPWKLVQRAEDGRRPCVVHHCRDGGEGLALYIGSRPEAKDA